MAGKKHIQHAISFIEHQDFNLTQVNQLSPDKVLQAPRSGND